MVRLSRRLILLVGAGLLGLLVLLAAGLVLLVLLVDPDRFKPRIAQAVQERTGRTLALPGKLQWRVFPWLVVSTGEGALGNPASFGGGEFARWQSLRLGVQLLPLLHKQVIVDSVRVDGVDVHLQRDARGQVNWQFESATNSPAVATPLQVDAIELRRGTVRYEDAQSGTTARVTALSLDAGLPAGGTTRRLRVVGLKLAAQLQASSLGAAPVPVGFAAPSLGFDADTGSITLPAWQASFGATQISGKMQDAMRAGDPLNADLQVRSTSLRETLLAAGIAPPVTADPQVLGRFELATQLHYSAGAGELSALRLRLDDTQLRGTASLASGLRGVLRFDLDGDRIALDRYLEPDDVQGKPLELPLAQLKALRASGAIRFEEASLTGAVLKGVTLRVEQVGAP